ncbi:MAG TPA: AAA domain-containing protein [Gemmatimonadaceae bacterium]
MHAAVGIELESVRRKSRADVVSVRDGTRECQGGAGATYRFSCTAPMQVQDDDRVTGEFDGVTVQGVVVSRERGALTLALEADLGPIIHRGSITIDRSYLWQMLRDRLGMLRRAPGAMSLRHVDVLTATAHPIVGTLEPRVHDVPASPLNREQERCLRQALGSDVCLGWGPPGTGKSLVCERVIADGFYASGLTTLLTAPTNKATDLLLGRVIRRLSEFGQLDAALAAGHIVRVGPISDAQLQGEYGSRIALDAIVARDTMALATRRAELVAAADAVAESDAYWGAGEDDAGERREPRSALLAQVADIDRRLKQVRSDALQRAEIVATTVHRAYMPDQVERMFDAVVLDEGGFTHLPAACCAAARARSHVFIAGDFRQLGPIVSSDSPEVAMWVARDPYHASGVVSALERGVPTPGLVALRLQHRSHSAIAELLNAVTYTHAPLETHASVLARSPQGSPWGVAPLMLMDTSPLRPFVEKSDEGDSRRNPVHAAIVRWLVEELGGANPGAVWADPSELIVLCPFREQLRLLKHKLPARAFARGLDVATVHRYQGDERNTVIFDLVDSRGLTRLSRLLQGTSHSDTGPRLVNVAASRARDRLIVVADTRHLLRATRRGPVHAFIRHLVQHATRIELPLDRARQVLTFVDRWERGARPEEGLRGRARLVRPPLAG